VKACTSLRYVLEFPWAAHKELIPVSLFFTKGSQAAVRLAKDLHATHLLPPPNHDSLPPLPTVSPIYDLLHEDGIPALHAITMDLRSIHHEYIQQGLKAMAEEQ
jgi:hypothetical protein